MSLWDGFGSGGEQSPPGTPYWDPSDAPPGLYRDREGTLILLTLNVMDGGRTALVLDDDGALGINPDDLFCPLYRDAGSSVLLTA